MSGVLIDTQHKFMCFLPNDQISEGLCRLRHMRKPYAVPTTYQEAVILSAKRVLHSSITLLSRVVDFFRECSVAVGTMSGQSQQPRPDRFEDLLQRQTRSFFLPQGRWLG